MIFSYIRIIGKVCLRRTRKQKIFGIRKFQGDISLIYFFYSFLQIKIQDSTLNVITEDKVEFTKVEGLFDSYKKFIKKYNINKLELIAEIKEYAKVFQDNFDIEIID